MLPIKTKSVFKSRWMALLWAGGIVWTAAEFVGNQPHPAAGGDQGNGDAADSADMQAAVNALGGVK
jgi:hypothetical protein